jgi:hypothetical protein
VPEVRSARSVADTEPSRSEQDGKWAACMPDPAAPWIRQSTGAGGDQVLARDGQPGRVIAIADKAQQRLCRRFRRLMEQHKPVPKVAVAIARELAGFLRAALQPAPVAAR